MLVFYYRLAPPLMPEKSLICLFLSFITHREEQESKLQDGTTKIDKHPYIADLNDLRKVLGTAMYTSFE